MALYQDWLDQHRGLRFESYDALWHWSVTDLPAFWQYIWDFFALHSPTPHSAVLELPASGLAMPGAHWFPGAQVNYAQQVFRHADAAHAAGHPALYLADTISSLGSLDFQMDAWKIDCVVGGSQKGLMLPTGMSFTGVSDKAMAAHARATLKRYYFDWTLMAKRATKSFIGTLPVNIFYGLRESIRLIEEEGLDNVVARHHRLGEATRRAVQVWSANNGPQLYCTNPTRYSDSVTAILMPDGHDPDALRRIARQRFNVSLGGGLGKLNGKVFRIGHLGDLNEPMLLGALAAVEMALRIGGVPHGRGGVDAAMDYLAG